MARDLVAGREFRLVSRSRSRSLFLLVLWYLRRPRQRSRSRWGRERRSCCRLRLWRPMLRRSRGGRLRMGWRKRKRKMRRSKGWQRCWWGWGCGRYMTGLLRQRCGRWLLLRWRCRSWFWWWWRRRRGRWGGWERGVMRALSCERCAVVRKTILMFFSVFEVVSAYANWVGVAQLFEVVWGAEMCDSDEVLARCLCLYACDCNVLVRVPSCPTQSLGVSNWQW